MKPKLDILPAPQQLLWPKWALIPNNFVLYGGTAVALQLGHRESVDFDFFSDDVLNKNLLLDALPFLHDSVLVHPEPNTLNCIVALPEGSVKLQFLAGLGVWQKRLDKPLICDDNQLQIATLRDLLATKLNTVQHRAEKKDYIDIHAMLKHGLVLSEGLAASIAVYGSTFDPGTTLRALCSFSDGDLTELSEEVKDGLCLAAKNVTAIPDVD